MDNKSKQLECLLIGHKFTTWYAGWDASHKIYTSYCDCCDVKTHKERYD